MSATGSPGNANGGLFAGTGWHHARYRPGYPPVMLDDLIHRLRLDGTDRLLDLGCGTGQLTLPLAAHVGDAVGLDPEPEMLTEAIRLAEEQAVTNVSFVQGNSTDLSGDLGRFGLVTMGRSFHWMDRAQVLTALDELVEDEGALVIANDSNLILPTTPWQQAVAEILHRFLPPDHRHSPPPAVDSPDTHEHVLANSPFPQVNRQVYEFLRSWSVEQAIGFFYSTSLPLRQLLGDRQTAFEEAVTTALLSIDPTGHFSEPVTLEVLTATRS